MECFQYQSAYDPPLIDFAVYFRHFIKLTHILWGGIVMHASLLCSCSLFGAFFQFFYLLLFTLLFPKVRLRAFCRFAVNCKKLMQRFALKLFKLLRLVTFKKYLGSWSWWNVSFCEKAYLTNQISQIQTRWKKEREKKRKKERKKKFEAGKNSCGSFFVSIH